MHLYVFDGGICVCLVVLHPNYTSLQKRNAIKINTFNKKIIPSKFNWSYSELIFLFKCFLVDF